MSLDYTHITNSHFRDYDICVMIILTKLTRTKYTTPSIPFGPHGFVFHRNFVAMREVSSLQHSLHFATNRSHGDSYYFSTTVDIINVWPPSPFPYIVDTRDKPSVYLSPSEQFYRRLFLHFYKGERTLICLARDTVLHFLWHCDVNFMIINFLRRYWNIILSPYWFWS